MSRISLLFLLMLLPLLAAAQGTVRLIYVPTKDFYLYRGQHTPVYRYVTADFADITNDGAAAATTTVHADDDTAKHWVSLRSTFQAETEMVPPQDSFFYINSLPRFVSAVYVDASNLSVGGTYSFGINSCSEPPGDSGLTYRVCAGVAGRKVHIIPFPITILSAIAINGSYAMARVSWKVPNDPYVKLSNFAIFQRDNDSIRLGEFDSASIVQAGLTSFDSSVIVAGKRGVQSYFAVAGYDSAGDLIALSKSTQVFERTHLFSLQTPRDGSALASTTPVCRWDSVPGQQYDLYLSTDSLFSNVRIITNLAANSYQFTPPLLDHTVYYWKVKSHSGLFSDETAWNFSINHVNLPPGTFHLSQPANVSIVASTTPLFEWNTSSDPGDVVRYRLKVATDPGFSAIVLDVTTRFPFYFSVGPLQNRAAYYWKVEAIDGSELTVSSQETFSFTVQADEPPGGFSLITPRWNNNDFLHEYPMETGLLPTFTWTGSVDPVAGVPVRYALYYDTDPSFPTPVIIPSIADTFYTLTSPLPDNRQIYWKVRAIGSSGTPRWNYGLPYSFVVHAAPLPPSPVTLLQPAENASIDSRNVGFGWSKPVAGLNDFLFYDLHLWREGAETDSNNFRSIFGVRYDTLPFLRSGKYFWNIITRAQTVYKGFEGSSRSATGTFTVHPGSPDLLLPADHSVALPENVALSWRSVPDSLLYNVQIAGDSLFTTPLFSSQVTDTTVPAGPLRGSGEYYWRVQAANRWGSAWSEIRRFSTVHDTASSFALFSNLQTISSTQGVLFVWYATGMTGGIKMFVECRPGNTGTYATISGGILLNALGVPARFGFIDTTVTDGESYAYRIRAVDLSLNTAYSPEATVTFTTGIADQSESFPREVALLQNFPNPFNPTTDFGFRIAEFGFVTLKIFDVLGREVAILVNEVKEVGEYHVQWNASGLPSGIYFYRLDAVPSANPAKRFTRTNKMILEK